MTALDSSSMSLAERYEAVRERIGRAAERTGRSGDDIVLIAVTKYAEPDQIRELITLGHVDFGENKVQQLVQRAALIDEWLARHKTLPNTPWPPRRSTTPGLWGDEPAMGVGGSGGAGSTPAGFVRWHMIGHVQRNKARKAAELCRLVHSVDSLRLAEELQVVALRKEKPIEALLQVNASGEKSKFGVALPAAIHLAEQVQSMINVRLRGLMTMAPHSDNPEDARSTFARTRELFEEMRVSGVVERDFNILSMGMSGDFEVAIEEGANMVRVGSALFGEPAQGTVIEEPEEPAESDEE